MKLISCHQKLGSLMNFVLPKHFFSLLILLYFVDPASDSLFDRTYNDERFMQADTYQNYNYRHNGKFFFYLFYFSFELFVINSLKWWSF